MTVDEIISAILKLEGGYVNHSADKGGATNFGVTLATLSVWRKDVNLTAKDVEALTEKEARDILRSHYFDRPGFSALPDYLWPLVTDAAVNHGPTAAIKMLQKAMGASPDGVLGPATLTAAKAWNVRKLAACFVAQRARKYGRIVGKDHSQAVFAEGWMNRLAEQIETLT